MPTLMPELSDEERDRFFEKIELLPDTELVWSLLEVRKLLERWVEPGVEGLFTRDTLLIGEVLRRRLDPESVERAFAIYLGETDKELRFPDFDSLGLGDGKAV